MRAFVGAFVRGFVRGYVWYLNYEQGKSEKKANSRVSASALAVVAVVGCCLLERLLKLVKL